MIPPLSDPATGGDAYAYVRRVNEDVTAMVNSEFHADWLPLGDFRATRERLETPASHYAFDVDTARRATPTRDHYAQQSPGPVPEESGRPLPERGSEHEAAVRLELLVRRSGAALSAEEDARLRVATERLRRLLPRVTAADFDALADIAEKVEATGRDAAALRQELGLDD